MKLLVTGFNPYSAVSWYRGAGVYQYLAEVIASGGQFVTWDQMQRFDALVMIRPATGDATVSVDNAKATGKLVIADYDDDVFNTNSCSPAYELTIKKEWRDSAFYCLKAADIVTVSTQRIADVFVKLGIDATKIYVIPNAYNDHFKPFNPELNLSNRFMLRGDEYCWNDVLSQLEEIKESAKKYDMVTVGNFRLFDDVIKRKEEYDFIPVPFFFNRLPELNCRVSIKPLSYHPFNYAKSNCSWIEATVGGSVLVASTGFEEFQKPGIMRSDLFSKAIDELMLNDEIAERCFDNSIQYIRNNLLLSKVNELRKDLLNATL